MAAIKIEGGKPASNSLAKAPLGARHRSLTAPNCTMDHGTIRSHEHPFFRSFSDSKPPCKPSANRGLRVAELPLQHDLTLEELLLCLDGVIHLLDAPQHRIYPPGSPTRIHVL